jgi:NAD(P)-dependent dehydrogenase (short-subunit alcohol dehydrogenase family)
MSAQRVALVTGGARGIGAAITRRLARGGAAVLIAGRTRADCETLARELTTAGGRAWPLRLDVTEDASVDAALAEARELLADVGSIEWLVNNAGLAVSAPLRRSGAELFERHLAVNLHGPRRLGERLLPGMLERGRGRVVNVASSAGLRGYAYVSAYCASKHALVGYTRAAALELAGTGVRVSAVCPHYVDSPMLEEAVANVVRTSGKTRDEALAFFRTQNPGGRLVGMDEVAAAVWAQLAEDSPPTLVELDGGATPIPLET